MCYIICVLQVMKAIPPLSLMNSKAWILVSNNVLVHPTSKQMFVIHDLQPSTGYRVRITAHNAAGSSVNTYSSTTLPSGQVITFIDKYLFI